MSFQCFGSSSLNGANEDLRPLTKVRKRALFRRARGLTHALFPTTMFVEVPYGHPLPPIRCPYVEKSLWVGYTASFRLLFPVQLPRALLTRFLLSPGIRNIWAFSTNPQCPSLGLGSRDQPNAL